MLSRPNSGISFSSPDFLVQGSIASSSGTRRQAGAALGVELRRMMTRFLLFHQTQDTTFSRLRGRFRQAPLPEPVRQEPEERAPQAASDWTHACVLECDHLPLAAPPDRDECLNGIPFWRRR